MQRLLPTLTLLLLATATPTAHALAVPDVTLRVRSPLADLKVSLVRLASLQEITMVDWADRRGRAVVFRTSIAGSLRAALEVHAPSGHFMMFTSLATDSDIIFGEAPIVAFQAGFRARF